MHGDVELIILWRYNASLDWDPFDRDTVSDGPVNELRVAAFRGRKLAIRDKNLFSAGNSLCENQSVTTVKFLIPRRWIV